MILLFSHSLSAIKPSHAMGTAWRDPRRGEIPVERPSKPPPDDFTALDKGISKPAKAQARQQYRRDTTLANLLERRGDEIMNIPQITSIENALQIYYSNSEIGNKEIASLFGSLSSATISRLKKIAKDEMEKREMLSYGMYKVNTAIAFSAWGIDAADLEKRMKKLKELDLLAAKNKKQ